MRATLVTASRDNVVLPAQLGLVIPTGSPFSYSRMPITKLLLQGRASSPLDGPPPLTPWPHRSSNSSVANVASWPRPCRVLFLVAPLALSLVSGLSPARPAGTDLLEVSVRIGVWQRVAWNYSVRSADQYRTAQRNTNVKDGGASAVRH